MSSGSDCRRRSVAWFVSIFVGIGVFLGAPAGVSSQERLAESATNKAIAFEFGDPNPWVENSVYSVYVDPSNTVVWRSAPAAPTKIDPLNPAISDLGPSNFWYAGGQTNGCVGRAFLAQRPLLVCPDTETYQPGERERRDGPNGAVFLVYDDLEVDLKRTNSEREIAGRTTRAYALTLSYSARRLDREGNEVGREELAYAHRLWVAEDLPYSPAFTVPFRAMGRLFVEDQRTGLGEYIVATLHQALHQKGLVLGVEMRRKGVEKPLYSMEAKRLVRGSRRLEQPVDYPVMEQSDFHRLLSMLALDDVVKSVDEDAPSRSDFSATIGAQTSAPMPGSAVYGSNSSGDFALILRVPSTKWGDKGASERELFLLIMRPTHGLPQPGDYQAANLPKDLELLPVAEIEEVSEVFTVLAMVREKHADRPHPTIHALWRVKSGELAFAGPDEAPRPKKHAGKRMPPEPRPGTLAGRVALTLTGITLGDDARPVELKIAGAFLAAEGLENVGTSKISQLLQP